MILPNGRPVQQVVPCRYQQTITRNVVQALSQNCCVTSGTTTTFSSSM